MNKRLAIGGISLLLLLVVGVTVQTVKARNVEAESINIAGDYIFNEAEQPVSFGSVQQSSEYHSTMFGGALTSGASGQLVTGHAVLGSLVITGANTGIIDMYNVTTTNVNLRAAALTTSTVLIASVPASTAAGTYTFDINAYVGLFVEVTGLAPTSTLTWR